MDIVYLWVDGAAPRSRAARAARGVHSPYQVSNHNELQFSLLSVHRYAPWARRIVILSEYGARPAWAGQFPRVEWLDQDCVLPAGVAPAFNNMVLEAYLHRIPNLSEPFLYFNDDYFLCKPVVPEMWLQPRWTFFRGAKTLPTKASRTQEWLAMTVKTADLCQAKWGGGARATYLQHTPYLMSGRAMEAVLRDCHAEVGAMAQRHHKRHHDDVVPILLMQEWLLKNEPRSAARPCCRSTPRPATTLPTLTRVTPPPRCGSPRSTRTTLWR